MRFRACAVVVALRAVACAGGAPAEGGASDAEAGASQDCDGRGETLHPGLVKVSSGGYAFELVDLTPSTPVLSQSQPGNTWNVRISDAGGAPLTDAALNVRTFMPDHNHAGPAAVGIEQEPGLYTIDGLLLPMPALYSITLSTGDESIVYSVCISAQTG